MKSNTLTLLLTMASLASIGQTSKLKGNVTNCVSKSPISGVIVKVESENGKYSYETLTDSNGIFLIEGISESVYSVKYIKKGFDNSELSGVILQDNRIRFIDVPLMVQGLNKRQKKRRRRNC
jgi:hypothetical protein